MARIRTIKPEFFTSLTIASLSVEARLTFVGLWTHVDDEGRCVADARLIKAAVWPLDDRTAADIELDLKELTESSLIAQYEVGGRRFYAVSGWAEHQRINRPTPSRLPAPPEGPPPAPTCAKWVLTEHSVRSGAAVTEPSLPEQGTGNREQGTGNAPRGAAKPRADLAVVDGSPATAQTLIGDWINGCRKRPPDRVVGQIARYVKTMLAEDIDSDDIRAGLTQWQAKGLDPSVLPSVVNQVMNAAPTRPARPQPSTADQRVAAGLAIAAQLEAREAS